jgi:predicted DNA repair protein MutK
MTGGFFAILDDIALLLDDAATMSKVAAKKTAGILGDDLAVNAEKATGFHASRELQVLWAITKGSFVNKLVILPLAFLLSAYLPWLIVPVLLIGGGYLSYEGAEKIYHSLTGKTHATAPAKTVTDKNALLKIESTKIKSAIRTDFILSIEIIIIALDSVMEQSILLQIIVVSLVAALATVGVYGVVALIVRMDDAGYFLIKSADTLRGKAAAVINWAGALLVRSLPWVIRALGVVGTAAMLAVGGGIFVHNIEILHHYLAFLPVLLANLGTGLVVGVVLLLAGQSFKTVVGRLGSSANTRG